MEMLTGVRKTVRILLLVLVGVLIFAGSYLFFLYYLFPYDSFENYIVQYLEKSGGVSISVGSGRVGFPLKLLWKDIKLERNDQSLVFDSIVVSVRPVPLLFGRGNLSFSLDGLGGTGDGVLKGTRNPDANSPPFKLAVQGSDFFVQDLDIGYKDSRANGRLGIQFENEWNSDFLFGDGFFRTKVTDLEFINVDVGGMSIPKVSFPVVDLKSEFENGRVIIKSISARGEFLDLRGKGSININKKLPMSVINVSGMLTIKEGSEFESVLKIFSKGKQDIKFSLTGTFARPRLKMNNVL